MEYRDEYNTYKEPESQGSFSNAPEQHYENPNLKYPPIVEEVKPLVGEIDKKEELLPEGVVLYKLKKPVEFEGVNYTELFLDFNSLTGADVERAIDLAGPTQSMMVELDKKYHAAIASRAAKVPYDLFRYLSIADHTAITMNAQSFILGL